MSNVRFKNPAFTNFINSLSTAKKGDYFSVKLCNSLIAWPKLHAYHQTTLCGLKCRIKTHVSKYLGEKVTVRQLDGGALEILMDNVSSPYHHKHFKQCIPRMANSRKRMNYTIKSNLNKVELKDHNKSFNNQSYILGFSIGAAVKRREIDSKTATKLMKV